MRRGNEEQEPITDTYRAKTAYKDEEEVRTYDVKRFRSWRGRMADRLEKRAIKRALAASEVQAGARLLDVACGTGRIARLLLELGYRVVGADVSVQMLDSARRNLAGMPNLESLDEADAEKLPYKDGEFDGVTAIRLMNHVPPEIRVRIVREMARVSTGRVIVSHCNPRSLSALKRRVKRLFRPNQAPWHPATYGRVKREAEQAGLRIVAAYPTLRSVSETTVYLLARDG